MQGNEDADGIAKEATEEEKDERIKVPYADWKVQQKEKMWLKSKQKLEIEGRVKGVRYFNLYYEADKRKP